LLKGGLLCSEEKFQLTLKLMEELRKEILGFQRLRTKVTGFKITFVSDSLGLILANIKFVPILILFIPAYAAIFFDLLITGQSRTIKQIGTYIRIVIEPTIEECTIWEERCLYEEFIKNIEIIGVKRPIYTTTFTNRIVFFSRYYNFFRYNF
jgi:hypothetical protein